HQNPTRRPPRPSGDHTSTQNPRSGHQNAGGKGGPVQRLSGMDASFLYMETPTHHMHVVGVLILDPGTMAGGFSEERVKKLIAARIHLMPMLRRRLVEVPLGVNHPLWIEDPDFNLDGHLQHVAVPPPGGMHELAEVAGEFASRPLDRS